MTGQYYNRQRSNSLVLHLESNTIHREVLVLTFWSLEHLQLHRVVPVLEGVLAGVSVRQLVVPRWPQGLAAGGRPGPARPEGGKAPLHGMGQVGVLRFTLQIAQERLFTFTLLFY